MTSNKSNEKRIKQAIRDTITDILYSIDVVVSQYTCEKAIRIRTDLVRSLIDEIGPIDMAENCLYELDNVKEHPHD
jgi:hypothetical protein